MRRGWGVRGWAGTHAVGGGVGSDRDQPACVGSNPTTHCVGTRPSPNPLPLTLVLLAAVAPPALARDALALLRRGDRAERASRYAGVKQIWACCPGAARHGPDYRGSVRIWRDGPRRTRLAC